MSFNPKLLTFYRESRELTKTRLSQLTGITRKRLMKAENGEDILSDKELTVLAAYFDLSKDDLKAEFNEKRRTRTAVSEYNIDMVDTVKGFHYRYSGKHGLPPTNSTLEKFFKESTETQLAQLIRLFRLFNNSMVVNLCYGEEISFVEVRPTAKPGDNRYFQIVMENDGWECYLEHINR